jgi:quercetin dioxygenase-like cupin family protein
MEEPPGAWKEELDMAAQPEGEFEVMGLTIRIVASSEDTGGAYAITEDVYRPGKGSPPHANTREDITVTAVQGRVEVALPDGPVSLDAGGSLHIPRGTRHWVRNAGSQPSKALYTFVPGGFEGFLTEVAALGVAPDLDQVAKIGASYGMEIAPPEEG